MYLYMFYKYYVSLILIDSIYYHLTAIHFIIIITPLTFILFEISIFSYLDSLFLIHS